MKEVSSLELLRSVIKKKPKASRDTHVNEWARLLEIRGNVAFRLDAYHRLQAIHYNECKRQVFPSSTPKKEIDRVHIAAGRVSMRALDILMPNGKCLKDCTGTYAKEYGHGLVRLGEYVGRRIIGKIVTESQARGLIDP